MNRVMLPLKNMRANLTLLVIALLTTPSFAFSQPSQTNFNPRVTPEMAAFGSRGVRVHDPSTIVKCDDDYWIFYTGRGVPSYHSRDLMTWESGPQVFTNAPAWSEEAVPTHRSHSNKAPNDTHDSKRNQKKNSISTFGKNGSAIGLVTTPTLNPS